MHNFRFFHSFKKYKHTTNSRLLATVIMVLVCYGLQKNL